MAGILHKSNNDNGDGKFKNSKWNRGFSDIEFRGRERIESLYQHTQFNLLRRKHQTIKIKYARKS